MACDSGETPRTTQHNDAVSTRLTVRTTVTIPKLHVDGIRQGGRLYIVLDGLAEWLDATADVFDKAHADKDIGGSIRACAAAAREAKDV